MKKKDIVKLPKGQIDEMQPFESWSIEEQVKYEKAQHVNMRVDYTMKLDEDGEILSLKKDKPLTADESHGHGVIELNLEERQKAKDEMLQQEKIFAYSLLNTIQNEHPEVLKEFIEQHYGK